MWVIDKLWLIVAAFFWYDKKQADTRLATLEKRQVASYSDLNVLEGKVDSVKELLESKINNVKEDTNEIKDILYSKLGKG